MNKNLKIVQLESSAVSALMKTGKLFIDDIEITIPSAETLAEHTITIDHTTNNDSRWVGDGVASYIVLAKAGSKAYVLDYSYIDNFYPEMTDNVIFESRKKKAAEEWEIEQIRTYGPDWKRILKNMYEDTCDCCCCGCECLDDED